MEKFKLSPAQIYKKCNPEIFGVETAKQITIKNTFMPQNRAMESFKMGINIEDSGYHIFAMGEKGIGKEKMIIKFLKEATKKQKGPKDWGYVHNFHSPDKPKALAFENGEIANFKKTIDKLIHDLKIIIPATFEGKLYKEKVAEINNLYFEKQQRQIADLQAEALGANMQLIKDEDKFGIVVIDKNKQPMTQESLEKLSKEEKDKIVSQVKKLKHKLDKIISSMPMIDKEKKLQILKINRKILSKLINAPIKKIKKKWSANKALHEHLDDIVQYILDNEGLFSNEEAKVRTTIFGSIETNPYEVFEINVMVDSSKKFKNSVPIIVLKNPSPAELLGMIEVKYHFGATTSNFNSIKPGALHEANGGYLIIPMKKFLEYPWFWQIFKNILKNKKIEFINFSEDFLNSPVGIIPMPIPLNVKIILLGNENIYYQLWNYDDDFRDLFKIVADFDDKYPYTDDNAKTLSELIANIIKVEKLLDVDKYGIAKIVEIAAKFADSQDFITASTTKLSNILKEANYLAKQKNAKLIGANEIVEAYYLRLNRYGKFKEHINKSIKDKVIVLQTDGLEVGQINGLAVIAINDTMFGNPQRITCVVYQGKSGVMNIERDVALSGSIHSKGVLILQSYLNNRFGMEKPISFSANVAFEQSYGKIDGDSATCAELYTILSALSNIPIKQSIAVTGSMDQKGRVQAIGGVNAKISGFFDVCKDNLDGSHGVIIPKSNIKDLMLPSEIRDAVEKNLFSIYAIENVDEGFEILTNHTLGKANEDGTFAENSVHAIIKKKWETKEITTKPV